MKCYTWKFGKVTHGIEIETDPSLGLIISLGEDGRGEGRYHEKVELCRKSPPEIEPEIEKGRIYDVYNGLIYNVYNGLIYNAHPVEIVANLKRNRHYYMLVKPDNCQDPRILVRINTGWIFASGTHGRWKTIAGAPEDLVLGYGARDIVIQRKATWYDGLVLLAPGDAVYIIPEGASERERYVVSCNENGIQDMLFSDYRRQADVVKETFI